MSEPTIPVTGCQYEIAAGDYRATVTEVGAGLRSLTYQGRDLITTFEPDQLPPHGAGQLLMPWPNRIDGGHYSFDGGEFQLDLSEPARRNAIHGLTRWLNWTQADAGKHRTDEITLTHLLHGRIGYPFCLNLSVSYRLDAASGLTVTASAGNAGSRPAPYGVGTHPYFTTGDPVIDGCELELPASHWLPVDDRCIPTGPPEDVSGTKFDFRTPRLIGDTSLDHALTGLARDDAGRAWVRLSGASIRIGIWSGPGCDWLQVFTSDPLEPEHRRRALAVEPMTCPPNAFATGHDRLDLPPAGMVSHTWGIEVLHS